MSYDEIGAARYDDDPEHRLPPEEVETWLAVMTALAGKERPPARVLDIGAGTGLLTVALKAAGYAVSGLEPSGPMVERALERNPALRRHDFVVGASDDAALFAAGAFDWIVSRQVLCHLVDPHRAFSAWAGWLRPGGRVLLVDGFWRASDWPAHERARQPFAAVQSARPVAEALSSVGFEILRAGPFGELNLARAGLWPGTTPRYLVAARKGTPATDR